MSGISNKKLAELIFEEIKTETFFDAKIIIPKIISCMKIFRFNIGGVNYEKIINPTDAAKYFRLNEQKSIEIELLDKKLRELMLDRDYVSFKRHIGRKLINQI